jgi:hypothetical protein
MAALAVDQVLVAVHSVQVVVTVAGQQPVVALEALQVVIVGPAAELVVALLAEQPVLRAVAAQDQIVAALPRPGPGGVSPKASCLDFLVPGPRLILSLPGVPGMNSGSLVPTMVASRPKHWGLSPAGHR